MEISSKRTREEESISTVTTKMMYLMGISMMRWKMNIELNIVPEILKEATKRKAKEEDKDFDLIYFYYKDKKFIKFSIKTLSGKLI